MKKSMKVKKAVTSKRSAREDRKRDTEEKPKKTSQAEKPLKKVFPYCGETFGKITNKEKERPEESVHEQVHRTFEHRMWEIEKEMIGLRADQIRGLGNL